MSAGIGWTAEPTSKPATANQSNRLEFEVASIRKGVVRNRGWEFLGGTGAPRSGLFSANQYLIAYIEFAYTIRDVGLRQETLRTLPKWASSGYWDINARANGTPTREEMRLMVRSLLEDRFKLKAHYESKRLPVSALVLAKPGKLGPRLQLHPQDAPCTEGGAAAFFDKPGNVSYAVPCATMDEFAGKVSPLAGGGVGIVVNRTGLNGVYDIRLGYAVTSSSGIRPRNSVGGPTFEEALEKQLGLKLVRAVESVRILVVDHVEPPTPN
jgi:uncharacterized protein (TIGR03435 family)